MIRLPNASPTASTIASLNVYQATVDNEADFVKQSAKAVSEFKIRNVLSNAAFKDIKNVLTNMCYGARRCAYCEDSMADEVEHIYPKNIYPSKCFDWNNYLYACGPCNGPKNNHFAVFRSDNGQFQDVSPPRRLPVAKPVDGSPVMINPRIEDGMDFCVLDLNGTFKFTILPHLTPGSKDFVRANYTFNEILKINDQREMLRKARANAYEMYCARLYQYDGKKKAGASDGVLNRMILGIQTESHPTVWKEIQRFANRGWLAKVDPELNDLILANPEALTW